MWMRANAKIIPITQLAHNGISGVPRTPLPQQQSIFRIHLVIGFAFETNS